MMTRKASGTAFVAAVVLLAAAAAAAPVRLKVTAELANIRLKPSISSVIIRQIPQGEILEGIRQEGEWYLVKLEPDERGAASGYVHESLVLPLEETPRPERKSQIAEPPAKKAAETVEEARPGSESVQGAEAPAAVPGWTLTLHAGGNYAAGGDMNAGVQGFADFFATRSGGTADQDPSPAHLGLRFGGELAAPLSRVFHLVVGADVVSTSKESVVSYVRDKATDTFTATPKFQAVPVKMGLAVFPLETLGLKVGVAYYIAKCSYNFRYVQERFWQEMTGEARANGLGLWGSVSLDVPFARRFAVVVEAGGQYAVLQGFEGTGTYTDSTLSGPTSEKGLLYAYDYKQIGKTISPLLLVLAKRPAEGNVENAREARVDFSGVFLRAGIKITF